MVMSDQGKVTSCKLHSPGHVFMAVLVKFNAGVNDSRDITWTKCRRKPRVKLV